MGDTISRLAAIDAFAPYAEYESNRTNAEWVRRINRVLLELPPAQPKWIPCTPETMPPDYQWYYATCKSLVDNRKNWVIEGCYTPWEHFNSTPMIAFGEAEVIAWMPREFPKPFEEGQNENI